MKHKGRLPCQGEIENKSLMALMEIIKWKGGFEWSEMWEIVMESWDKLRKSLKKQTKDTPKK